MAKNARIEDSNLDKKAKRIWKALFNEPFPKGWTFYWHVAGACDYNCRQIVLAGGLSCHEDIWTLLHEYTHLKYPTMAHGPKFNGKVMSLMHQLKKVAKA